MSDTLVESSQAAAGPSSAPQPGFLGSQMSAKEKYAERMKKLRDLHMKRNEARKLNHQEVVEEDRRSKLPKNEEARKRKAEYVVKEEEQKAACLAAGKDWEIEKLRHVKADIAEALDKKKRSKQNADQGFSSFEQATFRKYTGLQAQIKPDMELYNQQKEKMGDAFYAEKGTIVQGIHKDSVDAISRMALDVVEQKAKREKFSRRRRHDPDADIDYINERNMKFNQKCERFYGKYTQDIKDNLERGTAI